jgi:two-component system, NarL family, nitrate/nitrite response regulator NarL
MSATARVALIGAHPMFRVGIAQLLASTGVLQVVAEGSGPEELFQIARSRAPDLAVVDFHPGFRPNAVRRFAHEFPTTRLIIMTDDESDHDVLAALQIGAAGFLLKSASGEELIRAIWKLHLLGSYAERPLGVMHNPLNGKAHPARPLSLSALEIQILEHVARGLRNKQIGSELALSEKHIRYRVSAILNKLHVRSRLEAALFFKTGDRRYDARSNIRPPIDHGDHR